MQECEIIGIDVDCYCENYKDYRTREGLGFFHTAEDFMDTYGTPDTADVSGAQEHYVWYLDDRRDVVWRTMEVTFVDSRLYDIDIDYKE